MRTGRSVACGAMAVVAWVALIASAEESVIFDYQDRVRQIESVPIVFASWDNPALYAMLIGPGEPERPLETAIHVWEKPDWQALRANPVDFRDKPMAVWGRHLFSETVALMRPSMVDGGAVQQWVVQWGEADDDVAVVLLPAVDGAGTRRVPLRHARVAIPARFLGFWATKDRDGEPFEFPVFFARDAAVYDRPEDAVGSSGQAAMFAGIVLLLAVGGVVWWRVNRRGWEPTNRRRRREAIEADADDMEDGELPGDPVEALDRLTRGD